METESKFGKSLQSSSVVFFYVLIIYLPFYEFFLHFLESYTHLADSKIFWLTHFYEPLIVLFIIAYLLKFALDRRLPRLEKVDWYLIGFLALSFLLVIARFNDLSRGLEGLRFLVLPYIIYLIVRFSEYKNPRRLISVYVWLAAMMAMIAVVEYFLLPRDYMTTYWKIANFGFGQNSLIATPQATALLAGPNQLASYLLLAFFYLLHRYFSSKKYWFYEFDNYLLVLVTLAIGLTYSRSAVIGLFVGAVWMFIYFGLPAGATPQALQAGRTQRTKITYAILFLVAAVTLAFSWALQNGELLRDLITHGSSFSQHLFAARDSFSQFIAGGIAKILFGFGVGSAGPTALKLGGIVSENYFLQILFETGIAGLALFLSFIVGVLIKLYKSSKTLFFASIALLVNAFFLHIFSDNPAMAVSIFIIVATIINIETKNVETTQITTQT